MEFGGVEVIVFLPPYETLTKIICGYSQTVSNHKTQFKLWSPITSTSIMKKITTILILSLFSVAGAVMNKITTEFSCSLCLLSLFANNPSSQHIYIYICISTLYRMAAIAATT